MESLDELLTWIEAGDAEAFMELVEFVESNYRKILYTMGSVELDGLVVVKSCTYILIDRRNNVAYALMNNGKPEVVSFEVDGDDVASAIGEVCEQDEE